MNWPRIVICQCPRHTAFISLCVDNEDSGTRVFGGKCCMEQYHEVCSWFITREMRDSLVEELDAALEAEGHLRCGTAPEGELAK